MLYFIPMSVNKFATLKNKETGEVVVEMIGPPNALTGGDALSEGLYALSETIIRGLQPDRDGGGLGGRFGYGADFENDVFMMHPFCWCESDDCLWCGATDAPHFWHKASDLQVRWYKWIGRDMEVNHKELTGAEWHKILLECFESLPEDARAKAMAESEADAKREADPEYQRQQQEACDAMFAAISEAHETCEREGHDDPNGHCSRCGLITDFGKHLANQTEGGLPN